MRTVALLQARMSSTRLPGKVLLPLAGKPMLLHVVERMLACTAVDDVIVATTQHPTDEPVVKLCNEHHVHVYAGDLDDVLGRMTAAGEAARAQAVVRVTCDCPLVETDYVAKRLGILKDQQLDFTYCLSSSMIFAGASVMSMDFLRRLNTDVTDPYDREHCGLPYARRHKDEFRSREIFPDNTLNKLNYRLTVDEAADYGLMQQIYTALYKEGHPVSIHDVVQLLQTNPALTEINSHVRQNPIQKTAAHKAP